MRRFLATGFLLLQVPVLTPGLPLPPRAEDAATPTSPQLTTLSPAPSTQLARGHRVQNVMTFSDADEPAQPEPEPESNLDRELGELQTLRAQLAALERDVYAREKWLADATGTKLPPSLVDCDGVVCVAQTLFRKIRYAAELVFATDSEDGHDDLDRTIPVPPWRKPQNPTDREPPNSAGDPIDDKTDSAVALAVLGLFGFAAFLTVVGGILYGVTACLVGCGTVWRSSLPPPVTAAGGRSWLRVSWRWRGPRWQAQESSRMGDGNRGWAGDEDQDEKVEEWDEKEGIILEDTEVEDDGESEIDCESESDGDSEEGLTLGEELSSFRSALELVEGLVAETAARERR